MFIVVCLFLYRLSPETFEYTLVLRTLNDKIFGKVHMFEL